MNEASNTNKINLAEIEKLHEVIKDLEAELIGFKEENGFLNTDVAELSTKIELMDHEMEERK